MLCEFKDGIGLCGRVAPHSIEGRTQRAIRRYNEDKGKTLEEKAADCG